MQTNETVLGNSISSLIRFLKVTIAALHFLQNLSALLNLEYNKYNFYEKWLEIRYHRATEVQPNKIS